MTSVVFSISAHGFGHASRQIEIINALGARAPGLDLIVHTAAPRWILDRTLRVPFRLIDGACDTGVVQIDSLRVAEAETIRRAADFHRTLPARASAEASRLRELGARFVVSDAPALGCAAAAAAGIPSVVVSNFTWDWIYQGYPEHLSSAPDLVPVIQDAYRQAQGAWRLPMHGGFEPFTSITDVPFVARHARHGRAAFVEHFGLPDNVPLALVSFGGYGVEGLKLDDLDCVDTWGIVMTGASRPAVLPEGVFFVEEPAMYAAGLRYEDLVAAVDVVMTKPGYGIISECVANHTGLLYTSRGRFAEYDILVAEMPRYLRCGFIDQEALLAGRWRDALDRVLALPEPPERPRTDGAEVVAEMIHGRI